MKLLFGLGNPGEKYKTTRHNVGFMAMDALNEKISKYSNNQMSKWVNNKKHQSLVNNHQSLILAKPQTFMNESGEAVKSLANFYKVKPEDIYIIHDDLDIKLGEYKVQKGIGPKVHGGINSIEEKLGTKDFWRVRIGVDNRISENRIPGEEYVLQNFDEVEKLILEKTLQKIINDLRVI